jgi:hypothetical protein
VKLAVLMPLPPSRIARARDIPRPRPQPALHAAAPRVRLVPPLVVAPPPRPARARPSPLSPLAPAPVLRLVVPPPPAPVRLALRAPVAPVPLDVAPGPVPIATAVGILGTGGTRVIMVPADLTQPGRVDITQFRVALAAGVW